MPQTTRLSAKLSHLNKSDGSATFSQNGYTVIGSVTGPIEVQRRDELAEEAVVDVVVRPVVGIGCRNA
jgi:exosome complex component RRP46